jgi:hypothetical protein
MLGVPLARRSRLFRGSGAFGHGPERGGLMFLLVGAFELSARRMGCLLSLPKQNDSGGSRFRQPDAAAAASDDRICGYGPLAAEIVRILEACVIVEP